MVFAVVLYCINILQIHIPWRIHGAVIYVSINIPAPAGFVMGIVNSGYPCPPGKAIGLLGDLSTGWVIG